MRPGASRALAYFRSLAPFMKWDGAETGKRGIGRASPRREVADGELIVAVYRRQSGMATSSAVMLLGQTWASESGQKNYQPANRIVAFLGSIAI